MSFDVVILANKWWEAVVLVSVLEHARDIKPEFNAAPQAFEIQKRRGPCESGPEPRQVLRVHKSNVAVLCIEDYIPNGANSSSSYEKQRILASISKAGMFESAFIVAFGTAASPSPNSAGNVVIGSSVFVHDGKTDENAPYANFDQPLGQIVVSEGGQKLLTEVDLNGGLDQAKMRFLSPPNAPSTRPVVLAGVKYVSVGVINVPDSKDYEATDPKALSAFANVKGCNTTESVETTHGLIRLCVHRPFIYVSAIANEVGNFETEVKPNKYAQNFSAAHNAAVSVAWLLVTMCRYLRKV